MHSVCIPMFADGQMNLASLEVVHLPPPKPPRLPPPALPMVDLHLADLTAAGLATAAGKAAAAVAEPLAKIKKGAQKEGLALVPAANTSGFEGVCFAHGANAAIGRWAPARVNNMSYSHYFNVMCRMMCSGVVCAYFKKLRRRLSPEDQGGFLYFTRRDLGYRGARFRSLISARRRRKFF